MIVRPRRNSALRFVALALALGAGAAALGGCPIYSDNDCSRGRCDDPDTACRINSDCGSGYVCSSSNRCLPSSTRVECADSDQCAFEETCGRDYQCHTADCVSVGCAQGTCLVSRGVAACVVLSGPDDDASVPGDASAGCGAMGTRGTCPASSLCIANSCYVTCATNADAGAGDASADAGADPCTQANPATACKSVSAYNQTFNVCGSTTNVGTQCGGDAGATCDSGICIDGFCR